MELETEKHVSMEVSSKMNESAVELEEAKFLVSSNKIYLRRVKVDSSFLFIFLQ